MNMNAKKRFRILLCCLLGIALVFLSCKPITFAVAQIWMRCAEKARMLPETGAYINDELNLKLSFTEEGIFAEFPDGHKEAWYSAPGNRFCNMREMDVNVVATYSWKQRRDVLVLKFSRFPDAEVEGKKFKFRRCDTP